MHTGGGRRDAQNRHVSIARFCKGVGAEVLQEGNRQGVTSLLVEQNAKESLDISGGICPGKRAGFPGRAAKDVLENRCLKKAYPGL